MKKRILSIILTLSMLLSMLPATALAESSGSTIYVSSSGNDTENSGKADTAPVQTFAKALTLVPENGTIQIMDSAASVQANSDVPLTISKSISITGGSLTISNAGIILGADVTFKDISLNFTNLVRNAIIANGYTLTLENVKKAADAASGIEATPIHLFCGGVTGYIGSETLPTAGTAGKVVISGSGNDLGNIYAGSLSEYGAENTWGSSSTITIEPGASGYGDIYAHGAWEPRGTGDGKSMTPDSTKYTVSGGVTINLSNTTNTVDGATGGTTNATVTFTDAGSGYSAAPTLYNVGELTLKNGTADLAPASGSTISSSAAVTVPTGAKLDLSKLANTGSSTSSLTIGSLNGGGALTLGSGQTLTITGAVSDTTSVSVSAAGKCITAEKSTNTSFKSQNDALVELAKGENGVWTATWLFIPVADFTLTGAAVSDGASASLPVSVTSAGEDEEVVWNNFIMLDTVIKVGENNAVYNEEKYAYVDAATGLQLSFSTKTEHLIVEHSSDATLPAGTYTISVTVPAAYTTGGTEAITKTATLTVAHNFQYAAPGYGRPYFEEACACGHSATANVVMPTSPSPYDGEPKEVTVEFGSNWSGAKNVTIVYSGANSTVYGPSNDAPIDAGDYTVSITVNGQTYSGAPFTIGQLDISSADIALGGALTYNGQEQTMPVSSVTVDGVPLTADDYTVTDNTGTNTSDSYTLTVTAKDGGNFTGSKSQTWSIAQASMTITAEAQVIPQNGEIDQTKYLVTGLMSGHTLTGVTLNPSGNFIAIQGGTVSDGSGVDVTGNYDIRREGGALTITNKTIVDIGLLIPANLTYNGTDLSDGIIITATANGEEVTPSGYDIVITDAQGNSVDKAVDAGKYTVNVSVVDTDEQYAGTVTRTFTIQKKSLALTADSVTADVGDAAPASYTYTTATLAGGDRITTEPALSCTPSMSTPGSYPITIDVSGVVIQNSSGADVTDSYAITGANGTLTVSAPDSGGTPSTPSTPVTPSTPSYPSTPSTPSTPGTTTPTVSTGDQVEGGAVSTVTTATPNATATGGTATTAITASVGDQIVEQARENGSTEVVIAPTVTGDVTKTEVSIPASTVGSIGSQTVADLTVSTPVADVTIPNGGLSDLASAGGTVTVTAEKVGDRVTLEVTSGGETVSQVTGGITLTVPHDDCGPGTVAVLVHEDGTREVVRKSVADDGALTVTIPLDGSATLEIVDNTMSFEDVAGNAWYKDAVDFVSSRGLFGGVSDTAAVFDGDSSMTRGMLAVVLHRLEDGPDHTYGGGFGDVPEGSWYTEAVHWAAEKGIATGDGGLFSPDDPITREQLAVMLWRYAGTPATTKKELDFTDADEASDWAVDALIWAQENGIMQGDNNAVDPKGSATRSHVAQMLKNFMENILK